MDFNEQWREYLEYLDATLYDNPRNWFIHNAYMNRYRRKFWFLSRLNKLEDAIMARGKAKPVTTPARKEGQWTRFVDISLAGVTEGDLSKAFGSSDDVFNGLTDVVESGHRVSFTYNPQNDSVICSVTGKAEGCVNAGLTCNSFAGDWYTALRVMLYKHFVVASGAWEGAAGQGDRPLFG